WDQSGFGYLVLSAAEDLDHPLEQLPPDFISHELADNKGFLVLRLLEETVGEAGFRSALQEITSHQPPRPLTWEEFLQAVQKISPGRLDWFYSQWFARTGAPDWKLEWSQRGGAVSGT